MYNKIILVGNLTRDIELRYTQGGTALSKTAIATSRKFTANGEKKEEVMFVDITFFGRSAEVANQYLRKGSKVLVEGRLMLEQWQDQNGNKRSKHSVTVETMQMLDSKSDAANNSQGNNYNAPNQQSNDSYDGMSPSFGGDQAYQNSATPPQQQAGNGVPPPNSTPPSQGYQPQQSVPEYDVDDDEIPF